MYKLIYDPITDTVSDTMILRTSDAAYIPNNDTNRDWIAYQAWVAADPANVPEPAE